jgi:hypothetical protein
MDEHEWNKTIWISIVVLLFFGGYLLLVGF